MTLYQVFGPYLIPTSQGKSAKMVHQRSLKAFWNDHQAVATRRGAYMFAMRAGRGITPLYVGKATKKYS